jgi:malate synthase
MSAQLTSIGGLQFTATINAEDREILSDDACAFVADLASHFAPRIPQLLAARQAFQKTIDVGGLPDFLADTQTIRESDWTIKGIPEDLLDRRVEITGPVERKMIINALNANVKVFMADFEDSLAPDWQKVIHGQINMRDAVNRTIEYTNPDNGKHYKLVDNPAVLFCRARGLHLPEKHVLFNGQIIPGAIVDFGFYVFHNYKQLLANGSGPYFYLPKLQSHLEARWWAEMFWHAEKQLGLAVGTIKATVLIETLPAVFQMDEILYELRDHIVALNCGRWDYIFSYIKTLKNHPDRVLPDRQQVTMDKPFLNAYSRLLIKTCHHRGAMAMGGMAAFIPSKNAEENKLISEKVFADKLREVSNGHDGTWVAHPGLADLAMSVFDQCLPAGEPNNMHVTRAKDAPVTAKDLLEPCAGSCTEHGMRHSIRVALQYIEAWINGNGCVPIYGLMEDAATAEISRTSIWQWIRHQTVLDNGKPVTIELFRSMLKEEIEVVRKELGDAVYTAGRFVEAAKLLDKITTSDELVDFLTLPAYEFL